MDRYYEYKMAAQQNAYMQQMATMSRVNGGSGGNYGSVKNQQASVQQAPTGPDKRLLLLEDTP